MADDENSPPPTPTAPWWLPRIFDWLRRTQRSVADLAHQQEQTAGAIQGMRADIRDLREAMITALATGDPKKLHAGGVPEAVPRETSDEQRDRFEVLPGVALEMSRRRQRQLAAKIITGVVAGGGWLVALVHHLLSRH